MGRTACTEPQCLYSRAIPLLPLWAVRPVQSLSVCTRVHFALYRSCMWSTRYSCQILMKLELSGQILKKYSNIKFHEHPSCVIRVVRCGRTDRRDDAHSRLSRFCEPSCKRGYRPCYVQDSSSNSSAYAIVRSSLAYGWRRRGINLRVTVT
jgi:hypothetical protein